MIPIRNAATFSMLPFGNMDGVRRWGFGVTVGGKEQKLTGNNEKQTANSSTLATFGRIIKLFAVYSIYYSPYFTLLTGRTRASMMEFG